MEPKSGFLQDHNGHNSSSRLLGFMVTVWALVLTTVVVGVGLFSPAAQLIMIAASAGTLFTTIAGPAMLFMFTNKKEEISKSNTYSAVDKQETKKE
jgi:hypothetical protein